MTIDQLMRQFSSTHRPGPEAELSASRTQRLPWPLPTPACREPFAVGLFLESHPLGRIDSLYLSARK